MALAFMILVHMPLVPKVPIHLLLMEHNNQNHGNKTLFLLLILEQSSMPQRDVIFTVTVITVALSALLHGISATPLANAYARQCELMGGGEETRPAAEIPLREGHVDNRQQRKAT